MRLQDNQNWAEVFQRHQDTYGLPKDGDWRKDRSEPWEAFRDSIWYNQAWETRNRPTVEVRWAQEASDFRSIKSVKEPRVGNWICCWGHTMRGEWIQCAMLNWKDKPLCQRFKDHGHFAQHPGITMKQGLLVDEKHWDHKCVLMKHEDRKSVVFHQQ